MGMGLGNAIGPVAQAVGQTAAQPQVGPFGGYSGDPKPAPGAPGSPFNANLTYANQPQPGTGGKGGMPQRDVGFGNGPFDPNNPRLVQQPGVVGKGGVVPNAPTQLPPGVNLPMGGVPGNPGFPDPRGVPGNPGFPGPGAPAPQQPSLGNKGGTRPTPLVNSLSNILGGKGGVRPQPAPVPMPSFPQRDLGYGNGPINPNDPRLAQQPGGVRPTPVPAINPRANPMQPPVRQPGGLGSLASNQPMVPVRGGGMLPANLAMLAKNQPSATPGMPGMQAPNPNNYNKFSSQ